MTRKNNALLAIRKAMKAKFRHIILNFRVKQASERPQRTVLSKSLLTKRYIHFARTLSARDVNFISSNLKN